MFSLPMLAAPRQRAVQHPAPLTREAITAMAARVADRVVLSPSEPRLHWENAVYLDGLVLLGEQRNRQSAGSGDRFIESAASVILNSDDAIDSVFGGDLTAFGQAAMDLYRVLPPGDPRRPALLAHTGRTDALRRTCRPRYARGRPPRDPWWIAGGYGARFWQDDLYMVVPWLALYGSTRDGLPGNELAGNLAYEWIEAYAYEHRPASKDPGEAAVPSLRSRRGMLLWDDSYSLFQHQPETVGTSAYFWGRGNGWALIALSPSLSMHRTPAAGMTRWSPRTRSERCCRRLRNR
jgi:hypothetical protein